jgi:hypothetical protein
MDWKTLLAYISGSVDEELLLRNEYLTAENRILRDQIKGRVQLTDAERQTLADSAKKLGKKALQDVAQIVKPDTILAGNANLPLTNLMALTIANHLDAPVWIKPLRIWSSTWPRKIVAGATTDWRVPWLIWAMRSVITPWAQHLQAPRHPNGS